MIKATTEQHASKDMPMIYCDFCGEGISNRTEDANNVTKFKDEHRVCKKDKNPKIDFKNM